MSSKKRKTPADNLQPVTAVSALAARRRLAESVAADEDSEDAVPHSLTPSNAFSALRGLKRADSFSPSPKKSSTPTIGTVEKQLGIGAASPSLKPKESTSSKIAIPRLVVQYSSFVLSKRNSTSLPAGGLELRLQDGERFMIAGLYGLKLVSGHITVQGASIRPSEDVHWVHASHIHAIPVIRTHQETCLQLLSDLGSVGLQNMGRLSPLYYQIWWRRSEEASAQPGERTFEMLFTSDDAPKRGAIQELISPPVWNKKLAALAAAMSKHKNLTTLICGPKSAGKSTTSRLLVNRLLTSGTQSEPKPIALLDLDPGQPEYGAPGTLSLVRVSRPNLGVPFSHPGIGDDTYTVVGSHAIAAVSPASNPELYRECAIALYAKYRSELGESPLVINTPGWIQGTGLELLTELISHIKPHEVLYMSEDGPAESVDALRDATSQQFTTLPSQPSELSVRTAAELRDMQTMSYFHAQQDDVHSHVTRLRWLDRPLSTMEPIVIPYTGEGSIQGIICYDYQAPAELLSDSINGMVLALVGVDRPAAFRNLRRDTATGRPYTGHTPEGIPFIANPGDVALDPRHSQLLGLVLIRGIDTKSRHLLGLSPVLRQNLDSLNAYKGSIVLVHGNFGCPNWAYTESLHHAQAKDGGGQTRSTAVKASASAHVPWVEVLEGNQSRPVGSRRWRVRRDLGRGQ